MLEEVSGQIAGSTVKPLVLPMVKRRFCDVHDVDVLERLTLFRDNEDLFLRNASEIFGLN